MDLLKLKQVYYSIKKRLKGKTGLARNRVYLKCSLSEEWSKPKAFLEWAEKVNANGFYQEGWHLDKDILFRGNTVYGPETCVFVPQEINKLFVKANATRGKLPIGVTQTKSGTYRGQCCIGGGKGIFSKSFHTIEEAFIWYKVTKESVIKAAAEKWKGQIDPRVYNSLISYEVRIDD